MEKKQYEKPICCSQCGSCNILFHNSSSHFLCLDCLKEQSIQEVMAGYPVTNPTSLECKHEGVIHTITCGIFKKKYMVCDFCHELIPQGKWKVSLL